MRPRLAGFGAAAGAAVWAVTPLAPSPNRATDARNTAAFSFVLVTVFLLRAASEPVAERHPEDVRVVARHLRTQEEPTVRSRVHVPHVRRHGLRLPVHVVELLLPVERGRGQVLGDPVVHAELQDQEVLADLREA